MKILIAIDSILPAYKYGGIERAVVWLKKALVEKGHEVRLACHLAPDAARSTELKGAQLVPFPRDPVAWRKACQGMDITHFFSLPPSSFPLSSPYLSTVQGNGKPGERFLPNTVFISRDHAARHDWTEYVYNGLDTAEYPLYEGQRHPALLFLAKARWGVKNLKGALSISRAARRPYWVIGGKRPWTLWGLMARHAKFFGELGGAQKLELIQKSSALLFPVQWEEPFGIAVIEAMACGTPVIASRRGSLPEIISPNSGRICTTKAEYLNAIANLNEFNNPRLVRAWVQSQFTHHRMADGYLGYYNRIVSQGKLRDGSPLTLGRPTDPLSKLKKRG
jgi:glycosyltransferase involved in cell wall biosynthesis